jgi:hypothetical protein
VLAGIEELMNRFNLDRETAARTVFDAIDVEVSFTARALSEDLSTRGDARLKTDDRAAIDRFRRQLRDLLGSDVTLERLVKATANTVRNSSATPV